LFKIQSPSKIEMADKNTWLELMMTHYSATFRDKFDALVAFVHWCYIRNGFLCIGSPPPEMDLTPNRVASLLRESNGGSELLPSGWNSRADGTWTLAYKAPGQGPVVVLKAVKVTTELTLNVMKVNEADNEVRTLSIYPARQVDDNLAAKPARLFPELQSLKENVMAGIVRPLCPLPALTDEQRTDQDARGQNPDARTTSGRDLRFQPRADDPLRDLGRADLDPFGQGGGMVFDPLRVGRGGGRPGQFGPDGRPLPPGAVPPGARFDPFGPPGAAGRGRGRGRGFGPDPDHESPPGWDDMFM